MSDETKMEYKNFLGSLSWSSIPSAFAILSIVFIIFLIIANFINNNLAIGFFIFAIVTITIVFFMGLYKFQWIFFIGSQAKEIMFPQLTDKDKQYLKAQEAVYVTPSQLPSVHKEQKRKKEKK